jgi:hypothetical protein
VAAQLLQQLDGRANACFQIILGHG